MFPDVATEPSSLNEGFRYRDLENGVFLSRDPAGFVDGPNVYTYVKQNPWTAWDPEGLASEAEQYWKEQGTDSNNSLVYRAYAGFRQAAAAMNPANGSSSLREANSQFGEGIGNATKAINDAPIPGPLKSIAKFGLGVGAAGNGLNPINAASGLGATVDAVKQQGVGTVLRNAVVALKDDAINNPEVFVGKLLVGAAGAKATSEIFKGPLKPSAETSAAKGGVGSGGQFVGEAAPWAEGATPNSIYTQVSGKSGSAIKNAVYDDAGKYIGEVNFRNHGGGTVSGHGHQAASPGNIGSAHLPENHLLPPQVPPAWTPLPPNVPPHTPLGK